VQFADGLVAALSWLKENFFFSVPCCYDDYSAFLWDGCKTFLADRYGGPGMGHHGGSGRVGITGGFQVKGVGITPLIGKLADPGHSNGAVTLEEAIRETVYSELATAELPRKPIPIIAVIRTGTLTAWGEARALIVRPDFFRAGYLERAQDYLPIREAADVHIADSRRVRQSIQLLFTESGDNVSPAEKAAKWLSNFSVLAHDHINFCHANQLYFGPANSSNLTKDAEFFDYGTASALGDWCVSDAKIPRFGSEDLAYLGEAIKEIRFFLGRNIGDDGASLSNVDIESDRYSFSRVARFVELFGFSIDDLREKAVLEFGTLLIDLFAQVQRLSKRSYIGGLRTQPMGVYELLFNSDGVRAPEHPDFESFDRANRARLISALRVATGKMSISDRLNVARRKLLPRRELKRSVLQKEIYRELVERKGGARRLRPCGFRFCQGKSFPGLEEFSMHRE